MSIAQLGNLLAEEPFFLHVPLRSPAQRSIRLSGTSTLRLLQRPRFGNEESAVEREMMEVQRRVLDLTMDDGGSAGPSHLLLLKGGFDPLPPLSPAAQATCPPLPYPGAPTGRPATTTTTTTTTGGE